MKSRTSECPWTLMVNVRRRFRPIRGMIHGISSERTDSHRRCRLRSTMTTNEPKEISLRPSGLSRDWKGQRCARDKSPSMISQTGSTSSGLRDEL